MKPILCVAFLAVFTLAFCGCGEIEEAIEDLTTQNVDFYQGIFDGDAQRPPVCLNLANRASVDTSGPVEVGQAAAWLVIENILAMEAGLDEVVMGFSGAMENTGGAAGRVYIFFAPTSTPAAGEAVQIGSVLVEAGQRLEFVDSEGFDQTSGEIRENLLAYFGENFEAETLHVFLYSEGSQAGSILADQLNLDATPAFGWINLIPANLVGQAGDRFKDIVSVNVEGVFYNNGTAPARFVWVVDTGDEIPGVDENLVIDITLSPGQSIAASQGLVVPAGLRRLKTVLENLADGEGANGSLMVTSDETVDIVIDGFKVEFVALVGL